MSLVRVGEKALSVVTQSEVKDIKLKSNKKVLNEEKYTKDLEKIIVRDFYPDLPKLKIQQEYLTAIERNDTEAIRAIRHKYGPKRLGNIRPPSGVLTTPSTFETPIGNVQQAKDTPSTFETPVGTSLATPRPAGIDPTMGHPDPGPTHNPEPHEVKKKKTTSDLSLDKYLANATSEDNESFKEIIEEAEKKHRIKHAWLFDKAQELDQDQEAQLALPSIETQALTTGNKHTKLDTWTYRPQNALMYVPGGAELSAAEKIERQGKTKREIVHGSTRFQQNPFNLEKSKETIQEAASTQAILKSGKVGVDGKEVLPAEMPKVNGYDFLATPSPAPGVDASPLMTWGEIEGTPFRLDGGDTPIVHRGSTNGPSFKIPQVPARDRIGMELVEKASKAHRAKKEQALKQAAANFATINSPSFSGTSKTERLSNMSPAAQRLASNKLGIRTSTDKALRASYTPSPSIRRDHTPGLKTPTPGSNSRRLQPSGSGGGTSRRASSIKLGQLVTTPNSTPGSPSSASSGKHNTPSRAVGLELLRRDLDVPKRDSSESTASLTDNLLNLLPKKAKRSRATDFFD